MKKITVAIAGLGSRGKNTYAKDLLKMTDKAQLVAVAEPDPEKRQMVVDSHGIDPKYAFETVEELLRQPKLADALLLCTQDAMHIRQAIPALEKGYDLLLEKPISSDKEECNRLHAVAEACGRKVAVCHVLRFAPIYQKVKQVLDSGVLGQLQSIQSLENVAYWHQAHSFVRGNWRTTREAAPMIMAKSCHDMDLMVWLTGRKCRAVSSFGSLGHFKPECAPEGAAKRCMDGCKAKETCPYDAEKIYLTGKDTGFLAGHTGWPCNILTNYPSEESLRKAIQEGPYGRCVYFCDNDVVDHQVVNLEMEGGVTVNFTMTAFTAETGRYTKYMGTHGSMIADMDRKLITVTPFGQESTVYDVSRESKTSGHGGGDTRLLEAFLDYAAGGSPENITSLADSLESHYICMAAEASRLAGGQVMEVANFR